MQNYAERSRSLTALTRRDGPEEDFADFREIFGADVRVHVPPAPPAVAPVPKRTPSPWARLTAAVRAFFARKPK